MYLGLHPSGSFVFVPNVLPHLSFHDLDLLTPLVYVNMATVEIDDQFTPSDGKRARALMNATHGSHPSIYIVSPHTKGMDDPQLKSYILPSWKLKTPQRIAWHQTLLKSPGDLNRKRVFLVDGENIERYACPTPRIMERIDDLVRDYADRLLTNKQHAVQGFFEQTIRNPVGED